MLRVEARNSATPIEKKPDWIKTRATMGPEYTELKSLVRKEGLNTVCEEAGCPNIFECWEDREATFLIGGSQCTRRCDFCQIDTGKPDDFDADEPRRVAESVQAMGLKYSTITGVARDDLADGGAWLYAETVRQIHALNPGTGVELLIPDFNAIPELLSEVFSSQPEVLAHNLETVPRIFKEIRPGFRYERSLSVLTQAARPASSRSRTSSSAWARPSRRRKRPSRTCTTPGATSSPSRSTCAPPCDTTPSHDGSSRRSSCTSRTQPSASASSV